MKKRVKQIIVRVFLVVAVMLVSGYILLHFLGILLSGTRHVATLFVHEHTRIRITQENFCDPACAYYYQVFLKNTPLTSQYYMGASTDTPEFEAVTSDDGDLVIVIEKSAPDIVLMFYEFSTTNNYPGGEIFRGMSEPDYSCEDAQARQQRRDLYYQIANTIIAKIDPHLILSHEVSGRTLKIY